MTQDEIIRVVLALVIGLIVFTIFRKPKPLSPSTDPKLAFDEKRVRKPARMAMILFCVGAFLAVIYMFVNAGL